MIARACAVPRDALLHVYVDRAGTYTDCFEVMHPLEADLEDFITAFYTTWLFRLERAVLTVALRRRIRDAEATALGRGEAERFAAWTVEARAPGQILLCDNTGGTRSYLAVAPKEGGTTRLLFGSAVVGRETGKLPVLVRLLMPLHVLYSKFLLRLAERRMRRS
ncbi:hypothetical protein AB2B41_04350 [Marimonas sp. MJW-29]|uniref:DUF2867 domain-containing protein n=1 Tax=Sulfitobacter sediminis TaxID=3234186 RepID=A0ABV3RIN3_9RHOB